MLDTTVAKLLNEQVNKEFYSSYLYLDIANYYTYEGLQGFSNWFLVQAKEELDHAMLMLQYMQNNSEKVLLHTIPKPDKPFDCFQAPLAESLSHEKYITSSIHKIYTSAYEVKDFRTMQFLDWFVKEQGEEEKNAEDLMKKFELFGSDPKSLYMLNTELSARVYTAPSLVLS